MIRAAAARAIVRGARSGPAKPLTILLTSDAKLKALNSEFRRTAKLERSLFPASNSKDYLGDVAIAHWRGQQRGARGAQTP